MKLPRPPAWLPAVLVFTCLPAAADVFEQLVFGSFRQQQNAEGWARELEVRFDRSLVVEPVHREDGVWYRVRSGILDGQERGRLEAMAAAGGIRVWTLRGTYEQPGTITASTPPEIAAAAPTSPPSQERAPREAPPRVDVYADLDLGLQTRTYTHRGLDGQDRFQPSASVRFEYHRAWDDDRSSFTFTPFARLDADDDERTHADLRELFYSRVGGDWEVHAGLRQIFWGVTEFRHLVDIVNQTDLVENIDGEDKLGQPMVQLSLIRDWGIVDLFMLTGFRERTYPGEDGRLRGTPVIATDDARYASGAGQSRIDGAVRWSHHLGPLSVGVHYFSGTGRDPWWAAELADDELILVPEYRVIDQAGFDGQLIVGDWAWKLEALTRSGQGDRYEAFTAGFERTLVGVFGARGDLGLVAEYMYDERDEAAFDTLFEHDLALGTRWRANDMAGTTALLGVIWDVDTHEYVLSLEASRRLGDSWEAVLEGRVFGGAEALDEPFTPADLDGEIKSRALQQDDFIQLELTRYF